LGVVCNLTLEKLEKKPAKETSNIFHGVMAASVKDNPKSIKKKSAKKPS
jgi:hypothetical protein